MNAALSSETTSPETILKTTPELDAAEASEDMPEEAPGEKIRHPPGEPSRVDLLGRLEGICASRGLASLAERIGELMSFVGTDLATFEDEFSRLPRPHHRVVGKSAGHLLDVGGKRLRPLCVTLAARLGSGFSPLVLDLAVATELVHSATLLHDDVVDHSDTRRGISTARAVYGNASSIFAGDWLLIEALRRVERCRLPNLMDDLLDTIEEMILAESIQLENRGKIDTRREAYFQVVQGKTAALFRWAMSAGALAGGLGSAERVALSDYGLHLGIAFQATDDLLDLTGDAARTGKELFTDLREGKMTWPMIVALERDPDLRPVVEDILVARFDVPVADEPARRVIESLAKTGAVEDCLRLARQHVEKAIESLAPLAPSVPRDALVTVAEAILDRDL